MNNLMILSLSLVLLFSGSNVYADTFQSYDNKNYLYLEINDTKATGNMRIDGEFTSIDSTLKFYKNGNFKIIVSKNLILVGTPSDDEIKILVLERPHKQERTTLMIQKVDTFSYEKVVEKELTVMEKFELAQIQTGRGDIAEQNLLEAERLKSIEEATILAEIANQTSRTQYQLIDDVLELIVRQDFHVPMMSTFDFDLRAIDQNQNKYSQFYGNGYLDDVIITGSIIDPEGKVWRTINVTTNENGYYQSQGMYIPDNTPTNGEWFLDLEGIKYFDDLEEFSKFSIVKSFFVTDDTNSKNTSEKFITSPAPP